MVRLTYSYSLLNVFFALSLLLLLLCVMVKLTSLIFTLSYCQCCLLSSDILLSGGVAAGTVTASENNGAASINSTNAATSCGGSTPIFVEVRVGNTSKWVMATVIHFDDTNVTVLMADNISSVVARDAIRMQGQVQRYNNEKPFPAGLTVYANAADGGSSESENYLRGKIEKAGKIEKVLTMDEESEQCDLLKDLIRLSSQCAAANQASDSAASGRMYTSPTFLRSIIYLLFRDQGEEQRGKYGIHCTNADDDVAVRKEILSR
jgi:hypothetical protein